MSAVGPHTDWAEPVAAFLMDALPQNDDGWEDMGTTAWQFGCMALVALGYATDVRWGALRREVRQVPQVLPRWDDAALVVLSVLWQRREIEYRLADGTRYHKPAKQGQFTIKRIYPDGEQPQVPPPNIRGTPGSARVVEDHLRVLEAMGLIRNGAWTQEAELVLWREQPTAWGMNLNDDPRFEAGLARCLATMPDDLATTLRDLCEITPEDIAEAMLRQQEANAELIAKYPRQAKFDRPVTPERQFQSLVFIRGWQMDDLFFARWRFADGWLSGQGARRALPLFHDPLAQQMREAALTAMSLTFPPEMPQ